MRANFADGRTMSRALVTRRILITAPPVTDKKFIHLRPRNLGAFRADIVAISRSREGEIEQRERCLRFRKLGIALEHSRGSRISFLRAGEMRGPRSCCAFLVVADARQMEMQIVQSVGFSRET